MLRDGALIIKTTVCRLESLKPSNLTYGFLVEDTTFKAMPTEQHRLKIKVIGAESDKK